ncbi:manganese catalase family protein [Mycoplasmatota bacterium zrk1]
MWLYEKKLQFPVNIKNKDVSLAKYIVTQYGGPDGELGAAIRYLNQRYTMPTSKGIALLTDIGTEELGHVEMIQTMVYQLLKDATIEELKEAGLASHYTQHNHAIFPTDTNGVPFNAGGIGTTGDPIADLHENLAAEQKARATYEHLMDLTNDPEVLAPLSFLRQREIIHYQRFGEYLTELEGMAEN